MGKNSTTYDQTDHDINSEINEVVQLFAVIFVLFIIIWLISWWSVSLSFHFLFSSPQTAIEYVCLPCFADLQITCAIHDLGVDTVEEDHCCVCCVTVMELIIKVMKII